MDGRTVVTNFKPSFLNRDNPIIGAFAWVEQTDGIKVYTIMTKKEIDKSWSKAKTKNVQNDYPQEMAKRTVLSRAAKMFINSSSDNDLLVKAINETTEGEYDNNQPRKDITPNPPNIEKLEKSIFNQDENKKIAQDMIDSINQEPKGNNLNITNKQGYINPEIAEYFKEEYSKSGIRVVPGHWPPMNTRKDVDDWVANLKIMETAFEEDENITNTKEGANNEHIETDEDGPYPF